MTLLPFSQPRELGDFGRSSNRRNPLPAQLRCRNQNSLHVEDHRPATADGHSFDLCCNLENRAGPRMVGDCGCRIWNGVLYQSLPMSTDTDGDYTIRTAANCDAIVLPCVDVGVKSSSVDGTTRMAMAAVSNISGTAHTCFCSIHLGVCFRSPNVGDLWYSTTDSGVCCNANVKAIENDEQTHAPKSTTVRYFNGSLTFVDIGVWGVLLLEYRQLKP